MIALWLFTGPYHTLTYSATSTASLAVGLTMLFVILLLKRQIIILNTNIFAVIISIIIVYGTLTPFAGSLTIFDVSELLNRNETLTGRADIWAYLIPLAKQRLFLGYGYGGFWTDAMREAIRAAHAHNGYLDIILQLGFLGLALWSIFLITSCHKAFGAMKQDFEWGTFWLCFILISVVYNIAEISIGSFTNRMPIAIILLNKSSLLRGSN